MTGDPAAAPGEAAHARDPAATAMPPRDGGGAATGRGDATRHRAGRLQQRDAGPRYLRERDGAVRRGTPNPASGTWGVTPAPPGNHRVRETLSEAMEASPSTPLVQTRTGASRERTGTTSQSRRLTGFPAHDGNQIGFRRCPTRLRSNSAKVLCALILLFVPSKLVESTKIGPAPVHGVSVTPTGGPRSRPQSKEGGAGTEQDSSRSWWRASQAFPDGVERTLPTNPQGPSLT